MKTSKFSSGNILFVVGGIILTSILMMSGCTHYNHNLARLTEPALTGTSSPSDYREVTFNWTTMRSPVTYTRFTLYKPDGSPVHDCTTGWIKPSEMKSIACKISQDGKYVQAKLESRNAKHEIGEDTYTFPTTYWDK